MAPTFSKKPSIKQEDDGKRLLFECIIQADPKPTIAWIHGGKPVIDSPRHKVWIKIIILKKKFYFVYEYNGNKINHF